MADTPGPWKADGLEVMDGSDILPEKICELSYAGDWKANARLIADLLEALTELTNYVTAGDYRSNRLTDILNSARAAIAKAKGTDQ